MREWMPTFLITAMFLCGCIEDSTVIIPGESQPDLEEQGPDASMFDAGGELDMSSMPPRDMSITRDLGVDLGEVSDMTAPIAVDMGVDAGVDMSPEPLPRCSATPAACDALDPGATEHYILDNGDGCAFALRRTTAARMQSTADVIDGLSMVGKGYVSLAELSLNRTGQRGITAEAADRLKNHDYWGLRWNDGDMATEAWYPQGITGNEDANESGGRRQLIVSWYDHEPDAIVKGARISFIDLEDPEDIRYRHILLVVPTGARTTPKFYPVLAETGAPLHAGGIVWIGNLLYVADTTQGFRVFDLSKIIEVTDTDDTDRIGVRDGRMDAHGYRYIAPQIARYTLDLNSCKVRFSFVSLDRSTSPPRLLSGEYRKDDTGGRLIEWPIDEQTGWLSSDADGLVRATRSLVGGQTKMQGALALGEAIYISSSSQYNSFGRIYRTRVGQKSNITAWVRGAEDLYYERSTNRIWTAAEYPGARDVVSIPRQDP